MVSIEKVQRGAARYIDAEILPKTEGKDKWILTAASSLLIARLPVLAQNFSQNAVVQAMGIIAADGLIDIDAIAAAVKPAARQTPAKFKIPMGGEMTITEADIDTLRNYILQA